MNGRLQVAPTRKPIFSTLVVCVLIFTCILKVNVNFFQKKNKSLLVEPQREGFVHASISESKSKSIVKGDEDLAQRELSSLMQKLLKETELRGCHKASGHTTFEGHSTQGGQETSLRVEAPAKKAGGSSRQI